MIIEKWNAVDWWDDLEELARTLDEPEGLESVFAAKVVVLHTRVRACIFVVLDDERKNCLAYFTVKDCGNHAFVHDLAIKSEYAAIAGRIAKKMLEFILSLGFDEVKGQVRKNNSRALRLYDWLGFNITHHQVSFNKNEHRV